MTEKRFYILNYKNNPIYDSWEDKEYNAKYKKQRENLCDLLNELNDKEPQKIEIIKEVTPKYDDGTSAKWYYNIDNNITDGKEEYTVHRKEQVEYLDGNVLHGTNDLLDKLNDYEKEIEQLKHKVNCLQDRLDDYVMVEKENEQLKNSVDILDKVRNELIDENEQLKQTIQEAYETERTSIGKSVLKQLLEAIQ